MTNVTQFAQFILKLDPQKNPARLALYHFIKNFCEEQSALSDEVIDRFFSWVYTYQHWQAQQKVLCETVTGILKAFTQAFPNTSITAERDFEYQLVGLQRVNDLVEIIKAQSLEKEDTRIKVITLSSTEVMALKLTPESQLTVEVFGLTARIDGATLKPLSPTSRLVYDQQMELIPNLTHWIEGSLLTTTRFRTQVQENQTLAVYGQIIRGFTLQKYETINGGVLSSHQELFYNLKRLERYFVKPQSDPFYQELVSVLEKAYQTLNEGSIDGRKMAQNALHRGKVALKNIFPNDKLLLLLVTNIEYLLIGGNASPPVLRAEEEWRPNRTLN